jgi:hypothetical protein
MKKVQSEKEEIKAAAVGVKKRRRRIPNKAILITKLIMVCILLFGCCLFFFDQKELFWEDIMQLENPRTITPTFFFPFLFFGGIIFIIAYMSKLITRFESKELWKADRWYGIFQFVCTVLLLSVALRCFLTTWTANRTVLIIMIIAGLMTLLTPQIKDNDNSEF